MYIISNALKNIKRNRGRNILLGIIILALIIASVTALMINQVSSSVINDYKGRFGSEVTISANIDKVREEAMSNSTDGKIRVAIPTIPAEQYIAFGDSEYLKESYYTASVGLRVPELESVDESLGGGTGNKMMMGGPGMISEMPEYYTKLTTPNITEFDNGYRKLTDGEMPNGENEAIISRDFAELNTLSIGDIIKAESELNPEDRESDAGDYPISYELKIVGIYDDITEEYGSGQQQNAFTNRRNEILSNFDTIIAKIQENYRGIQVGATYYLNSPEDIDGFTEELGEKGLSDLFDVKTDMDSYNQIVGPVEGLSSVSSTFLIIVLIFGGISIAVISSIAIRERKYEIGVLRAMGMKKSTVSFSLWLEVFLITAVCVVIGIFGGTMIAQPIADILLQQQIDAVQAATQNTQMQGMMMAGGTNNAVVEEPLSHLDVVLNMVTLLKISMIALLLTTVSAVSSMLKIVKYEPIKILMERN
ncbi:ABC transporter permease [Lysinibacillus sp. CNPSo 3705]|uniref:ABC transporter permease n=1 Tax=Lysinibacillus sp. CNPSo 3705 TaxID=3028148 RepID=UPI0023633F45|nr:ABC transporter permease [Lysinibacillus sp. CNPSo 3705]MDD1504968.1 ABC transporter permease [Lysinibacillus sp. CNPSo 3705]